MAAAGLVAEVAIDDVLQTPERKWSSAGQGPRTELSRSRFGWWLWEVGPVSRALPAALGGGTITVTMPPSPAPAVLSSALGRTLAAAVLAWLALCALAWWWLALVLAPLTAFDAQVRRWRSQAEPVQARLPELSALAEALNDLARRQDSWLQEQASQHGAIRREAITDALTGLLNRRQFLSDLGAQVSRGGSPAHGVLVLVRMLDLDTANLRAGREHVDETLQKVARALETCARAAGGEGGQAGFAGRLNGPDFAICFPGAEGVAACGDGVLAAVESALAIDGVDHSASLPFPRGAAVGSTAYSYGDQVGAILAVADEALAQAEHRPGQHVAVMGSDRDAGPLGGEGQWRRHLIAALERGDLAISQVPMRDRHGGLLQLSCQLHLALSPGGERVGAQRWLPLALRTATVAETDLACVERVLATVAPEGPRSSVELHVDSLSSPGFFSRLENLLHRYPQAANRLCLELSEPALRQACDLCRSLGQKVRAAGAQWGVCHAGVDVHTLTQLASLPLDYLKLDASVTAGVKDDVAVRQLVRNLVATTHGLGILVHAEGVLTPEEAQALWACGVDGCETEPCASVS